MQVHFLGVSLGAAQRTAFCLLISAGNASFFKKLNRGDVFCSSDVAHPRRAGFLSAHAVLQGTCFAHPRAERVFLSAHVVLQLAGSGLQRAWREDRSWLRFFVSFVVLSLFVCFVVVCFCVFVFVVFVVCPPGPSLCGDSGERQFPAMPKDPQRRGNQSGPLCPGSWRLRQSSRLDFGRILVGKASKSVLRPAVVLRRFQVVGWDRPVGRLLCGAFGPSKWHPSRRSLFQLCPLPFWLKRALCFRLPSASSLLSPSARRSHDASQRRRPFGDGGRSPGAAASEAPSPGSTDRRTRHRSRSNGKDFAWPRGRQHCRR